MLSLAFWEWAEYISIIAIFLGVVGEYVADFVLADTTEEHRRKKTRLGKISTLVLIVGLALELPAIWQINGFNAQKTAALERDSNRSRSEAMSARSDIAAANVRVRKAEERIAKAGEQAAKANVRAGEAKRNAASSLAVAEKERLERVRLEAEVSPRRLSPEQRKGIAAACKRFAGHKLDVRSVYQGDVEAAVIALQIAESAAQGGLEVQFAASPHFFSGPMMIGIEVFPGARDIDFASAFVQILASDGKLESVSLGPVLEGALTVVEVGAKPVK